MARVVQISLRANRALTEGSGELPTLTPLGLVVGEHIDKLGFFEPALTVCDKTIESSRLTFTVRCADTLSKPLEEIVRGFRIGCFRIAREYGLVSPEDESPLFADGFECKELPG